ncbi:MAG: hypothetical protein JXR77_10235 [Lentisphaeria bacterium]|nr:hypothetical protein [Lentisphaeria bacterium]
MTPRGRFLHAVSGRPVDRVPLELPGFQFATREQVAKIGNPRRRELAERVFDQVHVPVMVPSHTNRMLMTPSHRVHSVREPLPDCRVRTRGSIDTPKGPLTFETMYDPAAATGWQVKYPVESLADIEAIRSVPWERPPGLRPPEAPAMHADLQGRGVVETRISSPFVCVAGMMSYEWFLELTATEPDLIHDLTDICRVRTLDCLDVLLSNPVIEYVWIGGSEWVTPPMASPAVYDALVQEQERSLIQAIRERSAARVHVHCHGHVRHALLRTIERGGDYTEPVEPPPDGDIALAEAKRIAAGRITLGGNIECRILCNEGEEAVERAVGAAFEGGRERFVLRPTEGPTPAFPEQEYRNYRRLIEVWEEMSPL